MKIHLLIGSAGSTSSVPSENQIPKSQTVTISIHQKLSLTEGEGTYVEWVVDVDLMDQKLCTYAYSHKSVKWYDTIHHRLREVALINAYKYIVYLKTILKQR